jgi:phosphoglycolate phosphatase-like HAD superfamily hydrolase
VSIAVFDIDGVVADVRHRLHLVEKRPKDWPAFFAAAGDDPGLDEGINRVLAAAGSYEIVWLTGRPNSLRAVTRRWLADHGLPGTELIMRGARDFRPAPVLKLAELATLRPRQVELFVDDDAKVVAAAAEAGFPAVLADWMQASPALSQALSTAQDQAGRT